MRLTLDALAVLDAIDRRGSFAAAAEELHRVPSAVTYQVQKLEEDLDLVLFDRRGHRAVLTAPGRELLTSGRVLLRAAGELEHRVKRVATGWEAELRIAVDTIIPMALVWPLCADFFADCRDRQASHTRLRFSREVLGGGWDALADGRADLVIGAAGDPPSGGSYRTRALADCASVFAVAPSHPLAAHAEPIPAGVVAGFRAVAAADTSRRLPPRTIGLIEGQDTLTVPDLDAKLAAQIAGLGCGYLPLHMAAPWIAQGKLVTKQVEQPGPSTRLSLAWRAEPPGKALEWWLDAVTRSGIGERLSSGAPQVKQPQRRPKRRAQPAPTRKGR
jgi:DNA-binding transcriptional LysR family regulator